MNRFKLFFFKLGFDWYHRRIIKKNKRSKKFRKLAQLGNFHACVIIRTEDWKIWRLMVFKGDSIRYFKHLRDVAIHAEYVFKLPVAEVIFKTKEDLYEINKKSLKSDKPMFMAHLDGRVKIKGNMNILFRYAYILKIINPFMRKIK